MSMRATGEEIESMNLFVLTLILFRWVVDSWGCLPKSRQAEPEKREDLESEVSSSLVDGRELLIEESIPAARSLANGSKRDLS